MTASASAKSVPLKKDTLNTSESTKEDLCIYIHAMSHTRQGIAVVRLNSLSVSKSHTYSWAVMFLQLSHGMQPMCQSAICVEYYREPKECYTFLQHTGIISKKAISKDYRVVVISRYHYHQL